MSSTPGSSSDRKLGELLKRDNRVSMVQLRQAQEEQRRTGVNLGYALVKLGFVSDREIAAFLAQEFRVPAIDLTTSGHDIELARKIGRDLCEKHRIMPVSRSGKVIVLAMADPANENARTDVQFRTSYIVEPVVATETAIQAAIERVFSEGDLVNVDDLIQGLDVDDVEFASQSEEALDLKALEAASSDAPIVRLVNAFLLNAIKQGASDIHIEPYEKKLRIRYRVDGVMHEERSPHHRMTNAIASRVKIMANLDIAERRLPQDGRIKLKIGGGKEMDFRVSVLPVIWGEKIVLRLLDKGNLQLDMTKLGFEKTSLEWFTKAIHMPYGMVLVTGPTGSGKTTTLYSALSDLNKVTENISTAEDPVEYNLPGINQVQMHDEIGLNFAAALRSFLRQDPDIVMVGEIRDFETAEIAVKAALTGHMVLSTLHTNDAPSTISRLLNMGIEPFLVTAATNMILAQRLARKVCVDCKAEVKILPEALRDMGFTEEQARGARLFKGKGCKTCGNTGYKGRVALYEVMPFWDELKELVLQGASTAEIKAQAIRCGLKTLRMSGITKCIEGTTSTEEILRVTASDENRSGG
jgi:type IV pilus assembly protein PilB